MTNQQTPHYDAIVIGAGFAGLAAIHYLREAGVSLRVFDRASDIGGTWTWNRYPGAMTDSESYYYCLTFSTELLQEWSWSARYPDWKETLNYFHFVADKCDMWRDIQLNTEIASADYDKPLDECGLPDRVRRAVIVHRGELTEEYSYLEQSL